MADPTKFDSGHVVVPVAHPEGNIDNIAVPADVPMSELHSALSDYYHPTNPTREGSVEFSPAFRKSAANALGAIRANEMLKGRGEEAGFVVNRDGTTGPTTITPDNQNDKGGMRQQIPGDALGALHTHDKFHQANPSQDDINAAKSGKTIYVASRDGLYSVDRGGVTKVFSNPDWATSKNPH